MTSADTDRLILTEYTEWAANRTPDSSIDTFLAEREAEHNKRRIADALGIIDGIRGSASIDLLREIIDQITDVLVDDRDYVIDSNGDNSITRRTFT